MGAGLSLAVAGSLALLVVSTVVAFRGWPDDLGSSTPVSVSQLAPAAERVAPHSLPRANAPVLVLPAVTVAPRVHRGTTGRSKASRGTVPSSPATSSPVTSAGTTSGSSPTTGSQPGGSVVQRTTTSAGEVVRQTTKQAADTVAPVAPAAAPVVNDVGSTAGDVVDKGGNAVAEALGHVGQ